MVPNVQLCNVSTRSAQRRKEKASQREVGRRPRAALTRVEQRVLLDADAQRPAPQVDAALVAEGVGVGGAAIHEAKDCVLVCGAQHALGHQQRLRAQRVHVRGVRFELQHRAPLARAAQRRVRGARRALLQVRGAGRVAQQRGAAPRAQRRTHVVELVQRRGAQELVGVGLGRGLVAHARQQQRHHLRRALEARRAQRVVAGAAAQRGVGAVVQQQPRRLHAVLLDGIVQRRLQLHVARIHLPTTTSFYSAAN